MNPCDKIRRYLDSYLDNELLVETNHEVLHHFETCPVCSRDLESRARLKSRLRESAARIAVPQDLPSRIQASLRQYEVTQRAATRRRYWVVSIAAALLLTVGSWSLLRQFTGTPAQLAAILGIGLDDHIECAVHRDYSGPPPTPAQMDSDMGPQFKNMIPVVRQSIPEAYRLEQAHRCTVGGRAYTHLIFRDGTALISVIVTGKHAGETIAASGGRIRQMDLEHYATAAAETNGYLVFVISNLKPDDNLRMARAVTPKVEHYLATLPAA